MQERPGFQPCAVGEISASCSLIEMPEGSGVSGLPPRQDQKLRMEDLWHQDFHVAHLWLEHAT